MKTASTWGVLCALLPLPVFGYSAEDAARPVPLTENQSAERPLREDTATAGAVEPGKDQILLPALKGVTIARTTAAALRMQAAKDQGMVLDGFSADEQQVMSRLVTPALGQPVSLLSLEKLTASIEAAFRARGWPFVKVSYPEQEITSGVIAILIGQARTGKVLLAGKPSFGLKFTADAFRTRPGRPLDPEVVIDDLEWINRNPLRRASISYRDGTGDALDLTLKVRAKRPWCAYAGIDNQLSEDLGDERLFLGLQYGDFLALDHRVTAQFTSSLGSKDLLGLSGIYEVPLPIRHLFSLSLGYTESETDSLGPIDQSGQFSRLGMKYRVPLPRWQGLGHEWRVGIESRNNDYLFSDGSSSDVRFFQWETGWDGRIRDRFGATHMDVELLFSPGQGVLGSEDEDFIALGAEGADSWIARIELERAHKLTRELTLVGRGQAQWADSKLLSSDQISAGGVSRVRGFDETLGYSSNGFVATLELQSRFFMSPKAGSFQGIAFVDAAALNREELRDVGQLASAGLGLRWRYEEHLSAKLDYGIPIDFPEDESGDPLLHFSLGVTW